MGIALDIVQIVLNLVMIVLLVIIMQNKKDEE